MEQIYYTQCPIGYGLGASNGFQVKRITPGYPLSGDFRHLGLRPFPAGGRSLAPPSLRYRRLDNRAEVAWLSPRPMEYETERGLWGRPGGHFAHGLLLEPAELRAIDDWPAGLFDAATWRRSDPEPSRGRAPDSVELSRDALSWSPGFAEVATLADGLATEYLAGLLAALSASSREGRTLFLIDEPGRLGPRVALLTYLFPPPLRAALTFSTYHDRPEDLPGFRIQGTTAAARPNRGLLLTQGFVADLGAGTIEPPPETAGWAREVATWVAEGRASDWADLARQMATAAGPDGAVPWDDPWLDRLVSFARAIRRGPAEADWAEEAELTSWASGTRLGPTWGAARGPSWWLGGDIGSDEGRLALVRLAGGPALWGKDRESGWGQVVARWFRDVPDAEREAAAVAFAKGAPSNAARFAFVQALRAALGDEEREGVLRRLDAAFQADPRMVALWSVPEAVASALAGKAEPIRALVRTFDLLGEAPATLLEAARVASEDRPKRIERLGEVLGDRFETPEALRWALGQGDRSTPWLRSHLRRRLAQPDDREGWKALADSVPDELRPSLTRTILAVASDDGLPDEAFVWGVEELLLLLPEEQRPRDPSWAGRYLDRTGSDLTLLSRLFGRGARSSGLWGFIEAARVAGGLSPVQRGRLSHLKALARCLDPKDRAGLDTIDLTRVPGRDRGPLLARLLRLDAREQVDAGDTLDRCGTAWSESLDPQSADLPAISRALAESDLLAGVAGDAAAWFGRLDEIRRRLEGPSGFATTFPADGLVARVVAARSRVEGPTGAVWELRNHLLNDEAGWRGIAEDFRQDLADEDVADAASVIDRWDRALRKGRPARFWEVALNVCDGRRLGFVVAEAARDLSTLGPLPWWGHGAHREARDDLREAFARLTPMAPIVEDLLGPVQNWMDRPRAAEPAVRGPRPWLSPAGLARWTCIDRLTKDIAREGLTDQLRCSGLQGWAGKLPIGEVPLADRYRLLAWVVLKLGDPSSLDVDRVGHWLVRSGLVDLDRLAGWPRELEGLVDVPESIVRDRAPLVRDLRQEMGRVIGDLKG